MTSPLLGEFMGTLVLILLGNGCVANVLLKHSKAQGSGWMVITSGWAFAVMSALFVAIACGSRDANINPAVTLGLAIATGSYSKVVSYSLAQMLGAFVGAILVWVHFGPHWRETEDPVLKRLCFCGVPAIRNLYSNVLSEIICTFILMLVAGAIFSRAMVSSGWVGIARALLDRVCGVGHRTFSGRNHRIRYESGARPSHAVSARHPSNCRKGEFGLELRGGPSFGPLIGASLAGLMIRLLHW